MPEHRSADAGGEEPDEALRPDAPVFAVAPVRMRTRVPRIALVGIVVAVLAFVAGMGVASGGPTVRGPLDANRAPGASGEVASSVAGGPGATPDRAVTVTVTGGDAGGSSPPPSPVVAGTSAFAAGFRPDAIVAATTGGAGCTGGAPREKEVPRTRRDGPRLTFQRTWLIWCPVPREHRQAFVLAVLEAFVDDVPATTYGYSATHDGAGDALYPYAEPPLAGTVAVTADAAGGGYAVAVVLEEWLSDPAR